MGYGRRALRIGAKWLVAVVVAWLGATSVLVRQATSTVPGDDTMSKLTYQITDPPTRDKKTVWRHGDKQLRIEQTDSNGKVQAISITDGANNWDYISGAKTGSHAINDQSPPVLAMPIFPGENGLKELVLGCEVQFFKKHGARQRTILETQPMVDRYEVTIGGKQLALDTIAGEESHPLRISCPECKRVKVLEYLDYTRVPYDASVFKPSNEIVFSDPTYFEPALNKPIAVGTGNVTFTVTPTSIKTGETAVPVWCFLTKGMASVKQPEVMVVVLKKPGESDTAYPHDPFVFFNTLALKQQTGEDSFVAGMFADVPHFVDAKFKGLLFIRAELVPQVTVPPGTLAAVPITAQEKLVCRIAGTSRTIGRLAFQSRYFPCPFWVNTERATVFSDTDTKAMQEDPLTNGVLSLVTTDFATVSPDQCTFSVSPGIAPNLVDGLNEMLKKNTALRIALQPDVDADGFLVWEPKMSEKLVAVGRDPTKSNWISGQHLIIVPHQPKDSLRIARDGFAFLITDSSLDKLMAALKDKGEFVIPLTESASHSFLIRWRK